MFTLRDYQEEQRIEASLAARAHWHVLCVDPTGAGKSIMQMDMAVRAVARGKRVGFWVNGQEIVKNQSRHFLRHGIDHGVMMGDYGMQCPWAAIQVCSVDTIHRRKNPPSFDVIFADEAHRSTSRTWLKAFATNDRLQSEKGRKRAHVFGFTATPIGAGLNNFYTTLIQGPSVAELIARGFLVPPREFVGESPDVANMGPSVAEDYNEHKLAERADTAPLVGDIVETWLTSTNSRPSGRGRPTVGFAVNIKHSMHIVEKFRERGVRAVHVDAKTPSNERDRTWEKLASGEIEVVSNVGIIGVGWDCPPVACIWDAAPTLSECQYIQRGGRGLRAFAGKKNCLYFDHAGNTLMHGRLTDDREWTLEGRDPNARASMRERSLLRRCSKCLQVYSAKLAACDQQMPDGTVCGWPAPVVGSSTEIPDARDGDLVELSGECWLCRDCDDLVEIGMTCGCGRKQIYKVQKLSSDPRKAELQKIAEERGYKPGWVYRQLQVGKAGHSWKSSASINLGEKTG